MPKEVLSREIAPVLSLAPAARTNGTANGTGADLSGYESATVIFPTGVVTDGTHAIKVQESDDNSAFTDVAAADLVGTALANLTSSTIQRIAYKGSKRYIRPVITTSGATTGAVCSALVVRGHAHQVPTS